MLRSFSPGHVEEYDQSHKGHEEHPASHGGDDKTGPLLVSGREGVGNVENLQVMRSKSGDEIIARWRRE